MQFNGHQNNNNNKTLNTILDKKYKRFSLFTSHYRKFILDPEHTLVQAKGTCRLYRGWGSHIV